MKDLLLGPILLLGGIGWAALAVGDWRRWRQGKAPWLPWPSRRNVAAESLRTEMNGIVEAAATIGNVLLGVVVALLGLAMILEN